MLGNQQMWSANNGKSERINISYSEPLSKTIYEAAIPTVEDCMSKGEIHSVQQLLSDSFGKANDEILSWVDEKWKIRNSTDTSITRHYELRFSVQVSDTVLTGEEIRGKDDTDIKIALYDQVTGNPVVSGPESRAWVEILFLDAGVDNFINSNSITVAEDNKPKLRNPILVQLKEGVGKLPNNVKTGHRSHWMKSCKCRLGAKVVNSFDGSIIKEASTNSFTVVDKRNKLKEKRDQPSLFDDVWTLKNIGSVRRKHLRRNNVSTVQEFLFLHTVGPQRLQEIFGASPDQTWKGTVYHAHKCDIDDKKIYLHCASSSSSECKNGVVFDVVGKLQGVLRNNSYVPIKSVTNAEKDEARKLLAYAFENQKEAPASRNKKKASAFENWNDIASFDDVASLLCEFPSSNDSNRSCYSGPSSSKNVYPSFGTTGEDQGLSMLDVGGELMATEDVLSLFNKNELSLSNDNNATNATGMDIDDNPTNSTGLEGHFGHHTGNVDNSNQQPSEFANPFVISDDSNATNATGLAFFDDDASVLREFLSATNSIGLDGYYGHHDGNAEYFNQQPSEFADSVPNSPLWNF